MTANLRLAVTSDLHWGIREAGDSATRALVSFLETVSPDVILLSGDVGADNDFGPCLELFDHLTCRKALVPGNHDVWVRSDDPRGDSFRVYSEHLPALSASHGFHYLDNSPLLLPEADLAIAGSMNWYDYSWSIDELRRLFPDELDRLQSKRFTRGKHNDANYVRWQFDDPGFTERVVTRLREHLKTALASVGHVIVMTHHPALYGLNFPRTEPPTSLDGLLWDAFAGNRSLEQLLTEFQDRIPLVFSGHTHRERENTLGPIRGYNIGGDYHFKRLLLVDWPGGTVEAHTFGEA
jgi:predicted phosphohydrolase